MYFSKKLFSLRSVQVSKSLGKCLHKILPDDWQKMSDEEVDDFIENHKWQFVEDWDIDDIWQQIGQIARSMRSYINEQESMIIKE